MSDTLKDYLYEILDDFVTELIKETGDDYETTHSVYSRNICYGDDIETAYYMNVPKDILNKYGYNDNEIDEKMRELFGYGTEYPHKGN